MVIGDNGVVSQHAPDHVVVDDITDHVHVTALDLHMVDEDVLETTEKQNHAIQIDVQRGIDLPLVLLLPAVWMVIGDNGVVSQHAPDHVVVDDITDHVHVTALDLHMVDEDVLETTEKQNHAIQIDVQRLHAEPNHRLLDQVDQVAVLVALVWTR